MIVSDVHTHVTVKTDETEIMIDDTEEALRETENATDVVIARHNHLEIRTRTLVV